MSEVEVTTGVPFNVPERLPLPDVKGSGGRLRRITRVLTQSCQDDGIVIIQTAGDAIVDTMWMFLTLNSGEVLEEYLDPRGERNRRKGKRSPSGRRRALRKRGKLFFKQLSRLNLNGAVAVLLPGRRVIRALGVIPGVGIFFKIFNIFELGLFGMLIYEAGDNFIAKWYSGLLEAQYCTSTVPGLFLKQLSLNESLSVGSNVLPWWQTSTGVNPDANEGWFVSSFGKIVRGDDVPSGKITATVSCQGGLFVRTGSPVQVTIGINLTVKTFSHGDFQMSKVLLAFINDVPPSAQIPAGEVTIARADIKEIIASRTVEVSGLTGGMLVEADWMFSVIPG